MVKWLDRNLFIGEEIKEVYEEIIKTIGTDHLLFDQVSWPRNLGSPCKDFTWLPAVTCITSATPFARSLRFNARVSIQFLFGEKLSPFLSLFHRRIRTWKGTPVRPRLVYVHHLPHWTNLVRSALSINTWKKKSHRHGETALLTTGETGTISTKVTSENEEMIVAMNAIYAIA